MRKHCDDCGIISLWLFVREYEDERGRVWEVYRCPECGAEREYAVR